MNPSPITSSAIKPRIRLTSANLLDSFPPIQVTREDPQKFIYTMVHEIRNPLTNINLAVELLNQLLQNDEQRMLLDIIMRNSGRVKDVVADILTSQNTNEIKPVKNSIHYLLDELLIMNKDRFMLKNVTVRKHYTLNDYKLKFNRSEVKIALA